jgi:hypothetical protein
MIACKGHQTYNPDCVTCVLKNDTSVVRKRKQAAEYLAKQHSESNPISAPRTNVKHPQLIQIKLTTQQLWERLHRYSWDVDEWNPSKAKQWYRDWKRLVNKHYGCTGCGSHWSEITAKHPPDFTSRESFFSWTVDRHNDVNERLSKPFVSLEIAIVKWGAKHSANEQT